MCFAYVCHLPSTYNGIHHTAEGRPPVWWKTAEGRLHYICAGEVANISKTHTNMHQISILVNFLYFSYPESGNWWSAALQKQAASRGCKQSTLGVYASIPRH